MRNNMLIMIAHGFHHFRSGFNTTFSRNNCGIKNHGYRACILLFMQISCKTQIFKSEHKEIVNIQIVVLIAETDQRCKWIEKTIEMWGKFYENNYTFFQQRKRMTEPNYLSRSRAPHASWAATSSCALQRVIARLTSLRAFWGVLFVWLRWASMTYSSRSCCSSFKRFLDDSLDRCPALLLMRCFIGQG